MCVCVCAYVEVLDIAYQVRLLLNAAKMETMVAINKAESLAQVQMDGCPLSIVRPDRVAIKGELNSNCDTKHVS